MSSAYYKDLKRSKEKELSDYKSRKSQLENIIRSLEYNFNDNVRDITTQAGKVSQSFANAIKFKQNYVEGYLVLGLGTVEPPRALADSDMQESYQYIKLEKLRVENKITELKQEIARLKTCIYQEEEKEKREREEKLKKLLGGS